MQEVNAPELLGNPDELGHRWSCRADMENWLIAFRHYFPRKAFLAERAVIRLSKVESIDALRELLPDERVSNEAIEAIEQQDYLYAGRRLESFVEDRRVLIDEFRILPDAADLFLTHCPVGVRHCHLDGHKAEYFDDSLCYYRDDQEPSAQVDEVIRQQYQAAKGHTMSGLAGSGRLGNFMHPRMVKSLLHFLKWDFKPDFDGDPYLDDNPLMTRLGWIEDKDLGLINCFSMPFTVLSSWRRDEPFLAILAMLHKAIDLSDKTALLLNQRPIQFVKAGRSYTAIGYLTMLPRVVPFFVTQDGNSFADLLVENTCFQPDTSDRLLDTDNAAFRTVWSLLQQTEALPLPDNPPYKVMPDNWMLPI